METISQIEESHADLLDLSVVVYDDEAPLPLAAVSCCCCSCCSCCCATSAA